MTFHVFFIVTTFFDLDIDQINIKTAFFYSLINQLVYMEIPKRFEIETNRNMVYKLL